MQHWLGRFARLWTFGKDNNLNTVHLTGDMDDVELVEDVEQVFGIKLTEIEAKQTTTIGELEQLIRSKLSENGQDDSLWKLLCRIVRDHSGHKGPIDRETTFFAEDAKERMSNG